MKSVALLFLKLLVTSCVGVVYGAQCPTGSDILPCRCTEREGEIQIWCSHSEITNILAGLTAVGNHVTRPVDELILENNYIPSLPGSVFSTLRVTRLMLRDNGLERVATGWLAGLEDSLLELFLVEPKLRSIPPDSLEQLRGLEAITLRAGAIKRIPRLSGLRRLRYIQIQSPSLMELSPEGFKMLPDLENLHIVYSPHLTRLEAGLLSNLPRLKLLNVSNCGVNWLHPRAISRLPSLTELSLTSNRLTDAAMVGRAIRDLSALTTLRLDNNLFERLGEATFVDLPSLREIHLTGNRILEIQRGAFHRTPELRKLDLSRNFVRHVHPESFLQRSDSGVEELWLVDNALDHVGELRALLDGLPRLRYLDMSNNYLEEIPFGALRGHPTLERLHLDHNRIQRVQREAFMAMPALRELRLRNNSLENFADGPIWNLPALKGLDLAHNNFRRVDPLLLANLPSLRRLDLSGNAIVLIDPASFLQTSALEHINISRNALVSIHPATFRQLVNLYELDVGWNRLREIVPGLPRGVEYLHLPRNQITSLPPNQSPDLVLPSLKLLDLRGNGIQHIPPGTFGALLQLRWLYLGENAIQQIDAGSLNGLPRLETLSLPDNRVHFIHGRSLRSMRQLREIDLRGNRLEILKSDVLQDAVLLQRLDVSVNQLLRMDKNALVNNRKLLELDVSHNSLTELPEAVRDLSSLQLLDLSNNRIKVILPKILGSMSSLTELHLNRNKLQELPEGAFDNLPHLTLLDLDSNELQSMSSNSITTLPELKAIRLGHNKLQILPEATFSNLPELQSAELQKNHISSISENAFHNVPQLLLLNLSHNELAALDQAGLQSLKSLEVLDLSNNRVGKVGSNSLSGMEWLVELKMDNNHICNIHGSPFNGMPRLRVLSLRNNKMTQLTEPAFQRLRNNIAVLDIDGNPLTCSCRMMWLQKWLQEASGEGPRCADGSLLKEKRLSRSECEGRRDDIVVAPGCEAETAVTSVLGPSQYLSTWLEVKNNNTSPQNNPLPEDSEYFYDEYVEYQYEEANSTTNATTITIATEIPLILDVSNTVTAITPGSISSHYVSGDTPTIYAGSRYDRNKTAQEQLKLPVPNQPTDSSNTGGFTFFGIPLPSISLGSLWGNARNADGRPTGPRFIGARGKVQMLPPSPPDTQTGGFVPTVPDRGGFIPIANPHLKQNNHTNNSQLPQADDDASYSTWPQTSETNKPSTRPSLHDFTVVTDGYRTETQNQVNSHDLFKRPYVSQNDFRVTDHPLNEKPGEFHDHPSPVIPLQKQDIVHPFETHNSVTHPKNSLEPPFQKHNVVPLVSTNQSLPKVEAINVTKNEQHHTLESWPIRSHLENKITVFVNDNATTTNFHGNMLDIATTKEPLPTKNLGSGDFYETPLHKGIKFGSSSHSNQKEKITIETSNDDVNITEVSIDNAQNNDWHSNWFNNGQLTAADISTAFPTQAAPVSPISPVLWGMITSGGNGGKTLESPSSLSILLAPGAQQPQVKLPSGRSSITKVAITPSPPVPVEEYLRVSRPSDTSSFAYTDVQQDDSKDWYFRNYNNTNLVPYIGPGSNFYSNRCTNVQASIKLLLILHVCYLSYVTIQF